jgi:hypothetical protein
MTNLIDGDDGKKIGDNALTGKPCLRFTHTQNKLE